MIQPRTPSIHVQYLNTIGPRLQNHSPFDLYTPVENMKCANESAVATFKTCKNISFQGTNPKLYDSVRAQSMVIDRPPLSSQVYSDAEIYSPHIRKYGKLYTSYNDIVGGNILYYIPDSSRDAYRHPVFTTPASVFRRDVQDPMGVVRPEFDRITQSRYGWDKCNPDACDSYTHDTLEYRQELMEKQMRARNAQEYRFM